MSETSSFHFFRLEFDRLAVHKYTLALVRLRLAPFSDIRRKLCDDFFVYSLQ